MVQGVKRGLAFQLWYGSTGPRSMYPGGARPHIGAKEMNVCASNSGSARPFIQEIWPSIFLYFAAFFLPR